MTQPTIRMSYHLTAFSHCQGNHPQMAKLLSYVQAGEIDYRHYTYIAPQNDIKTMGTWKYVEHIIELPSWKHVLAFFGSLDIR